MHRIVDAIWIVIIVCIVVMSQACHVSQPEPPASPAMETVVEAESDARVGDMSLDDLTLAFFLNQYGNPRHEIQQARVCDIERTPDNVTAHVYFELIDPQLLPVGPRDTFLLKLNSDYKIVSTLVPWEFCNCPEVDSVITSADVWDRRKDESLLDSMMRVVKPGDPLMVVHLYPE
jgi:hypothetical protein